jgi:hypothetical protein
MEQFMLLVAANKSANILYNCSYKMAAKLSVETPVLPGYGCFSSLAGCSVQTFIKEHSR